MTQESATEVAPFQVDHHPDDHPDDWTDDCYLFDWRRDFVALGKRNLRYKVVGLALAAFAKGDGTCIHPGNKALTFAVQMHPVAVNKVVRDLLRDDWIEVTHEATPTSPRVFALRHPESAL